jgi:hypothetical protein
MREVVFKAITSQDHKTRQLCFREFSEDYGVSAKVEKRWSYTLKRVTPLSQIPDLKKWISHRIGSENSSGLKHLSVFRYHNSKTEEDKFEYQLIGDLFVVNQENVFTVEFSYFFGISSVAMVTKK